MNYTKYLIYILKLWADRHAQNMMKREKKTRKAYPRRRKVEETKSLTKNQNDQKEKGIEETKKNATRKIKSRKLKLSTTYKNDLIMKIFRN